MRRDAMLCKRLFQRINKRISERFAPPQMQMIEIDRGAGHPLKLFDYDGTGARASRNQSLPHKHRHGMVNIRFSGAEFLRQLLCGRQDTSRRQFSGFDLPPVIFHHLGANAFFRAGQNHVFHHVFYYICHLFLFNSEKLIFNMNNCYPLF